MIITQLKQQVKNPDRASIFVDGKYSFSLTLDQVLQEKLKKGVELDEARLTHLKKLSEEGKIRARALEWVMRRPHSTKELRDYLYKKKVDKDYSELIVQDFTAKKYISDEAFARWFAEGRLRKHKSSREITAELMAKGIQRDVTVELLHSMGTSSDEESLLQLIAKLRTRSRYQDEQKLIAYLQRKGFSWNDIKSAINEE